MKYYTRIIALLMAILIPSVLSAITEFTITPNSSVLGPFVDFDDIAGDETKFANLPDKFFNLNKDVLPDGLAMVNTLGYPNGKSTIKKFPHFQVGASAGGGIYKYKRKDDFDKDDFENNPVVPGGGANAGVHIGTGITNDIDLTIKFFSMRPFYNPNKKYEKEELYDNGDVKKSYDLELENAEFYSFGAKARYNLISKIKIFPFDMLNFGGVSINFGFDYLRSRLKVITNYSKIESGIEFDLSDPTDSSNSQTTAVDVLGEVSGTGEINSNIYSFTPEIFVYLDFLYLFSIYTGPSLSINYGTLDINIKADGKLTNKSAIIINTTNSGDLELIKTDEEIATASFSSRNRLRPTKLLPKWTFGLELNLWKIKVQAEVAAVLTSVTESFTGQVGARFNY